jgi:hypothetical protein
MLECRACRRVQQDSARANIKNNFSRPVKPVQFMLNIFYHHKMRISFLPPLFRCSERKMVGNVQLQEGKVAIAVVGLVLALLGDIFLEGGGGLRVVSVEAVEDGLDVFRPVRRVVER